jgi:hypothetical protein
MVLPVTSITEQEIQLVYASPSQIFDGGASGSGAVGIL